MEPMNDELLIKSLLQETDPEEEKSIKEWLTSNPENQKRFDQLKWVWDSSEKLARQSTVDGNEAWQRFLIRRDNRAVEAIPTRKMWQTGWMRVAASLTLLAGIAWAITYSLPHHGQAYFSSVSLESGDAPREERLLDGSTIVLNRNTALSYSQRLFSHERTVRMTEGEAYFDVTSNPDKPFIIEAQDLSIAVLGTSFHVKISENRKEVILDKGSVEVRAKTEKIVLIPGEKAYLLSGDNRLTKSVSENSLHTYYVTNRFVADNTPLEELVSVLEEAYNTPIDIGNESLKKIPITTTLPYRSLDDNLEVIKETLNVQVLREKGRIIIQ